MNSLEKFLVIENKVNDIFNKILNQGLSEAERLSTYLEQKVFLEKIKGSLKQVSETDDIIVKSKAEDLLKKIDSQLSDFANKHLNIGSTNVKQEDDVVVTEVTSNNTTSDEYKKYIIVANVNLIQEFYKGTKDELLQYINKMYDENVSISVYEVKEVPLKVKNVYTF